MAIHTDLVNSSVLEKFKQGATYAQDEARDLFDTIRTAKDIKTLKDAGVKVHHATITPKMGAAPILVTPPG